MKPEKMPVTQAVRALRGAGVAFAGHSYAYEERGGTRVSARELGVDEHRVIKTIVLVADGTMPVIALMHGDLEVSTKALARLLGAKTVEPAAPALAERLTGYQVGGTSPFGTRTTIAVVAHSTIRALESLYINGGKRGFLVQIHPDMLDQLLKPEWAEIAA